MRWLKDIAKSAAAVFGVLALAAALRVGCITIPKADSFFVDDAELEDPGFFDRKLTGARSDLESFPDEQVYPVIAHRIKGGRGTVLGYRRYTIGSPVAIDDERYQKITIWLPERYQDSDGQLQITAESGIVVVCSRGGSAWPRTGLHGKIEAGTLDLHRAGRRIRAHLEGVITYVRDSRGMDKQRPDPARVSRNFVFTKTNYDDLTPWLGLRGQHIYWETHRR